MKNLKKIMTFIALLSANITPMFAMTSIDLLSIEKLKIPAKTFSALTQALQDKDDTRISSIMANLSIDDKNDLLKNALNTPTLNYDIIKLLLDNQAILYTNDIDPLIQADNVDFIKFLITNKVTVKACWTQYSFAPNGSGLEWLFQKIIPHNAFNILTYLFDNNYVKDETKSYALDNPYNMSSEMITFLIDHGIQPSKYTITNLLDSQRLAEAEICLQHPAITLEIKNKLVNQCLEENCSETTLQLLIKHSARISEKTLIAAIHARNIDKVKLFLQSGAVQATEYALKTATEQYNCPQEILDLLLDHGASIPLASQRTLLSKSTKTIHAKILLELINAQNRIQDATDLNDAQKEILINTYKQLNLFAIFNRQNYESLNNIPYLDISDKLLMQYFPLGIWINEQHDKLNKCASKKIDDIDMITDKCAGFFKNLIAKKDLTLTEQLFINLASNHSMAGENTIFSGKDPRAYNTDRLKSDATYYNAGFAGDLFKTNIIPQVTKAEQEFNATGFQTFFHGRAWEWNFVNDVWNMLCTLKTGESNPDKISLRFRDQNCDVATLQEYRNDLIKNGADYHFNTGTDKSGKESEVTCMNITPISNPGYFGECTGTYFIDNRSIGRGDAVWKMIEKMFKQANLESYFIMHKQEFEELYNQHKQTNQFGELLCIAVQQDAINTLVYPAKGGGYKVFGNATDNIKICTQSALNSKDFFDKNHTFYCLAVSDIPGEYGTKYTIKSLNLADPEKYEAYKQARDAFAQKMKIDVQTLGQE